MAFTRSDAKDGSTMEGVLGPAEAATMSSGRIRQLAEKDLANYFKTIGESRPNRQIPGQFVQIGDQVVAFGEATGDVFAMILIDVRLVKPDPKAVNPKQHSIVWTVRFQRSASEADEKNAVSVRLEAGRGERRPAPCWRRASATSASSSRRFMQYLQRPIPAQLRP